MINKKVAIIGCGRIAGHHCRAVAEVEGLEIAAICDLELAKAENYGAEFDVPYFVNYHEMLSTISEIDIVVIATPSGMHFEHAVDVMKKYRKHIVVEKPTFMRPSQVRQAYQIAREVGVKIFPIFQNRFNQAVQRVKSALDNGELGDIRLASVRVRWCRPQRYYDLSEWRGTYAMDGGAITNQGIHHVDLLRHLVGDVKQVFADMNTYGADIEVEDTVTSTLKFESGASGTLEVTTSARPDDFEASISIVGSKGLAQIGGIAVNELQVFTIAPGECEKFSEDFTGCVYGHGHKVLYESISMHFSSGDDYLITEDDCYNSILLLHMFYCSDEEQQMIKFSDQKESVRLGIENEDLTALYRTPPTV